LRTLGYRQDKLIERKAFEAADKQRVEEYMMRKTMREQITSKQIRL